MHMAFAVVFYPFLTKSLVIKGKKGVKKEISDEKKDIWLECFLCQILIS